MANITKDDSVQLGVRIPSKLLAALDAEADALSERVPGHKFTRSDAVRSILTRVLDRPVPTPPSASEIRADRKREAAYNRDVKAAAKLRR